MRPPYSAHLRVYEPLAAFPAGERARWEAYAARSARTDVLEAEVRTGLRTVVGRAPVVVPALESGEAFVLDSPQGLVVCPWQTRLRTWEAVDEVISGLPDLLVEVFLPPGLAADVAERHRRWRLTHPDARCHIRTARWYVPIEWFAVVGPAERELRLDGERCMTYRTGMGPARRRAARALRAMRRALGSGEVVAGVEDLARWLEEFHPRSVVELDYGGLVELLPDDELEADSSVQDVAEGLAALDRGDEEAAVAAYRQIVDRWRPIQALEHAN
jgi:hypothetical protein